MCFEYHIIFFSIFDNLKWCKGYNVFNGKERGRVPLNSMALLCFTDQEQNSFFEKMVVKKVFIIDIYMHFLISHYTL